MERILFFIIFYPMMLLSLSVHESAHAWTAARLGDPTALYLGRVSLNPMRHIDPIGTFLLPFISILTGARLIGWGKPVPVNHYNFENPRRAVLWVSLAGPLSNIILALIFALGLRVILFLKPNAQDIMLNSFFLFIAKGIVVPNIYALLGIWMLLGSLLNLYLAFFNLIPIHPLDGGGILRGLLPKKLLTQFDYLGRYGIIILLGLVVTGAVRFFLMPADYIFKLLFSF